MLQMPVLLLVLSGCSLPMKNRLFLHISTLGPLGYAPASGTVATIFCLPLVYLLSQLGAIAYAASTVAILLASLLVISAVLNNFKSKDPSEIVLDELVGILITFLFVKVSVVTLLVGLILFRFFDILKPVGITRLEQLSGSYGIVLDDALAGVYSCVLLHIFIRLF